MFVAPGSGGEDADASPPRKIASIGVGVRGWVTCHGFALNVEVDLDAFEAIIPCGLDFVEMTSVARELGASAGLDLGARVRQRVAEAFVAHWQPKDL